LVLGQAVTLTDKEKQKMDSPENCQELPEKSQESPENVQEIVERQPENYQENVERQPENVQEIATSVEPKRGRPKKSEEEKKKTRQEKYQRAKERRQVRVVEPEIPPCPPPSPREHVVPQPAFSAAELLQRVLRESKEQERQRKEALYDSWFARLKRNACH
jgi:hypothetical protein